MPVLLVASCSGDDGDTTAPSTTAVPPTTAPRVDDGQFIIGLVTPTLGAGAEIGQSVRAAVLLAANDVNASGGIAGQRIRVVRRDEGDDPSTAQRAVQDLVDAGADAIIGPTSSVNLLGSLGTAVDGGVLTCAPTATALALDDFPDEGLLVRTAPSDALQARALAQLVDESGSDRAVVLYLDDPYGRPFADDVRVALAAQGIVVTSSVGFTTAAERVAEAAETVAAIAPTMIVVIADGEAGALVIEAVEARIGVPRPSYVVNDAMRLPAASGEAFSGSLTGRIQGVSPIAYSDARFFIDGLAAIDDSTTGLYAANAYDCVNLIALAGVAAGTTQPAAIGAAIAAVSTGGTTCNTFPRCVEAISEGRNINYDSPGASLDIGPNGDPSKALFERFSFDLFGGDVAGRRMTVSTG